MSELEINTKLKHISSMIFNIVIQNKIVVYEEYSDFDNNDSRIKEFEELQLKKYKSTIDKWIVDSEIDKKIEEYILLQKDPYGLQTNKINLINDINDSFFELERKMIVDTSEIRDSWKSLVFAKYDEEINKIKLSLEEVNNLKADIEFKLSQSESENKKIKDNLILCEQSKAKIKALSDKYKSEKEQLNKTLIIKNKEIREMSDENQVLGDEIKKINYKYTELKNELESIKIDGIKSEETQKEISHYKKLLNSAKEIKIKCEKEVSGYMHMIDTLNDDLRQLNNEISNKDKMISEINKQLNFNKNELENKDIIIKRKEKENEELKRRLNETIKSSKKIEVKPKMSLEEFKSKGNKVILEIQSVFRTMLSREKNIEGESCANICREPYSILNTLKSCQSVDDGLILINKIIPILVDIKKKCDRSGLNYNLESGIEKLYELKEKNS